VVNAVTLEVTPEQAENLDLARSVGTLSLVLRNQVDIKAALTEGGTKASMLNEKISAPKALPIPVVSVKRVSAAPIVAHKADCIDVISGTEKHSSCF
jgi:pilus assembly protein CpaB